MAGARSRRQRKRSKRGFEMTWIEGLLLKRACDDLWRSTMDETSAPRICAAGGPDTAFGGGVVRRRWALDE
jgi:hypothetical protein